MAYLDNTGTVITEGDLVVYTGDRQYPQIHIVEGFTESGRVRISLRYLSCREGSHGNPQGNLLGTTTVVAGRVTKIFDQSLIERFNGS